MSLRAVSEWAVTASQDNAEATASKAGVTGQTHYITHVAASFSAAATKLLQVKDGSTVLWEGYVVNAQVIPFDRPLKVTRGAAASAVLAASGTGGVLGKVNIAGFTEPD